jgi:hypothetical protein
LTILADSTQEACPWCLPKTASGNPPDVSMAFGEIFTGGMDLVSMLG